MLYYNAENLKKFIEAIKVEARKLGVDLVGRDLDRSWDYCTSAFLDLESLVKSVVKDMRGWFSSDNFNVKEIDISVYNMPWDGGEFVRIQTRCKR